MTERALGRAGLRVGPHGFGTAPLANLAREVSDDAALEALEAAWQSGVRYYDTAPHYGLGLGERRLGQFLRTKPRNEYIISTKVGRLLVANPEGDQPDAQGFAVVSDLMRRLDYSADGVRRSLEGSLDRLGLDRVDIVFVHDPDEHYQAAMDGAFQALDTLRCEGVIASYGAGMNQTAMLTDFVLNTDLDVVMCAGRYTLLEQGALGDLLPAASDRNVSIVAAAVFNSGLLARDRPPAGVHYDYAPAPDSVIARVNAIADVCEAHGVPLPAAALQFALGHPAVATVCTGARSRDQVCRNLSLASIPIPNQLWSDLVSAELIDVNAPTPTQESIQ